ncbi:winged helix DNA-binding protein [Sphingomonas sp. ac-8]|uniref:winged helix DNA-binding protein n=1 Tax=Sphingomonas sp. ac-8 TaxID=3242977 RepID=UPI003A7FF899
METFEALARDFARQVREVTSRFEGHASRLADAATNQATHPDKLAELAARLAEQRRIRRKYLPSDLFHEPGWDMLVALYVARHQSRTMNVKALVGTSAAPTTTSQRWIEHLDRLGLIVRVTDPLDRRRIEVSLSEAGATAMTQYLQTIAKA